MYVMDLLLGLTVEKEEKEKEIWVLSYKEFYTHNPLLLKVNEKKSFFYIFCNIIWVFVDVRSVSRFGNQGQ